MNGGSIAKDDASMKGATVPDKRSVTGSGHNAHRHPRVHRVGMLLLPNRLPEPVNPALLKHAEKRAESAQNQVADHVTAFSGSMLFVYIHILWFGCWIGFGVEEYPFGLLTMIVSLEAIFLSTFVMISQNRADAKRQALADQQWMTVQEERDQNKELLDLARQTFAMTKQVHAGVRPGGSQDRA